MIWYMNSTDFVVQNNMSVLCFLKSHFQLSLLCNPNEQQNARRDSGTIVFDRVHILSNEGNFTTILSTVMIRSCYQIWSLDAFK